METSSYLERRSKSEWVPNKRKKTETPPALKVKSASGSQLDENIDSFVNLEKSEEEHKGESNGALLEKNPTAASYLIKCELCESMINTKLEKYQNICRACFDRLKEIEKRVLHIEIHVEDCEEFQFGIDNQMMDKGKKSTIGITP